MTEVVVGVLALVGAALLAGGMTWASHVSRRLVDEALARANDGRSEDEP